MTKGRIIRCAFRFQIGHQVFGLGFGQGFGGKFFCKLQHGLRQVLLRPHNPRIIMKFSLGFCLHGHMKQVLRPPGQQVLDRKRQLFCPILSRLPLSGLCLLHQPLLIQAADLIAGA